MTKNIVLAFTLSTFVAIFGCAGSEKLKKPDFSKWLPAGPPAKALAVWEPAVRHDGDKTPERGFGGRVYFYDQDAKRPIKVKGNVVVYAFDEEGRKSYDNIPSRSYLFDRDDLKKLYSKSKLGHSYNFWIPWDAEGPDGKAKKVSLIVRYIPDVGSSVVSSQAVVYLPGKRDQTEFMAKAEWESRNAGQNEILQVAHRSEPGRNSRNVDRSCPEPEEFLLESNPNRPSAMQTATISIPKNLSQGIEQALARPMPKPETPEIQPVNFITEKPAETKTEEAPAKKKTSNPRRDPANRRGTF